MHYNIFNELITEQFPVEEFNNIIKDIFSDEEWEFVEKGINTNGYELPRFHLFRNRMNEKYIVHLPSRIVVNWYNKPGSYNTCSNPNMDLEDLRRFFELLHEDVVEVMEGEM